MISFAKLMRQVLSERVSFRDLFRISEPGRKQRAKTDVKARSIRVNTMDEQEVWTFNYKSNPSTTGNRWHGYVRFFKEDVSHKDNAMDLHCMVDCDCFSGDVLVLMKDGTYKQIQDIKIGDEVFTHLGRIRKVTNVMSRRVKINEPVYNIKVMGFPNEMTVTGNHPFYTLRGNDLCLCGCHQEIWKSAYSHECSSPSLILGKKYSKGHYKKSIVLEDKSKGHFEWVSTQDFREHEWFLTPWIEEGTNSFNDIIFSRLVGYYAAEGCIPSERGTEVRLTFNINEFNTLGADVLQICNLLKYNNRIYKHRTRNCFDIRIFNKSFKDFCIEHIGKGSFNKKFSGYIMSWNNECLKNVFIGSILGDGWIDPNKGMKYFSISFNLITQISTILNKLKIRNNISILNNHFDDITRNTLYQVIIPRGNSAEVVRTWLFNYLRDKDKIISPKENIHSLNHWRGEGQIRPMIKYEESDYTGMVYDITVDEDSSFIANGIAVHNCPDYRYRYAYNNSKADIGVVGNQPEWKYANQNNGKPPRSRAEGGVGDYGVGMCKHLCSLAEFLKTQIEPNAPEPEDEIEPKTAIKPSSIKQPRPSSSPSTSNAPDPDDSYSDSRQDPSSDDGYSDSRGLQEEGQKSMLYEKFNMFVKSNPVFGVTYE